MLKPARVILAIVSLLAVTALFVDVTGYAASHWAWMAKIQLVPALLALNFVIVGLLLTATLIFGRVYCSVICPLGIYQDVVSRIATWCAPKRKRRAGRFRYKPGAVKTRYIFFVAFLALLAAGLFTGTAMAYASIFEPYSAFGRMAAALLRPGVVEANNILADLAAQSDSTTFVHATMPAWSIPVMAVAAVTLIVVTLMAWTRGRDYCNKVCPVGTLLGLISRESYLRPVIDTAKCNGCGSCARHCKASCIDPKSHAIDYSRCVACFDCLGECSQHAITYRPRPYETMKPRGADRGRRAFLIGGSIAVSSLAARAIDKTTDGGLAPIKTKKRSHPAIRIVPAGAKGAKALSDRCTACQLCIAGCPNHVLRPSESPGSLMQPEMAFDKGWCRPECTVCGDVCPVGAIAPIDLPLKSSTKIGTATVDTGACISAAYGQACGNCSRHCPTGAITMVSVGGDGGNLRPLVDENTCIGCGSCEYHCPVGRAGNLPGERAAIHVEGIDIHHLI